MTRTAQSESCRWLLLPVEVKVRELQGKLLLAAFAAEAGFSTVLGDQNVLLHHLKRLPRGIYLDKSIARTKTRHFERLKQAGHHIAAWCEEGLVYLDRETYLSERVSLDSLGLADRFFAWGERQRSDIASHANGQADKVLATGNPRMDVLRPELRALYAAEVEAIRDTHAPYILVNTNFGRYNHYLGPNHMITLQKQRGIVRTEAEEAYLQAWCDHAHAMFDSFVAMLPDLAAAFPDRRIVVRPHPAENHDRWRSETAGIENVAVIHDGSAAPWIIGADALVHAGCSTGLEAFLLSTPVYAYRAERSETFDAYLPNAVSHECASRDELIAAIRDGLDKRVADDAEREVVDAYIAGLHGPFASQNIVAALRDVDVPADVFDDSLSARVSRIGRDALQRGKRGLQRALSPAGGGGGYAAQKFPGLQAEEASVVLERLRQATGRFDGVDVASIPALPNCVIVRGVGQA